MTDYRKILFTPEPDITAYELAIIIGKTITVSEDFQYQLAGLGTLSNIPIYCDEKQWTNMTPGIRRHWTVQS